MSTGDVRTWNDNNQWNEGTLDTLLSCRTRLQEGWTRIKLPDLGEQVIEKEHPEDTPANLLWCLGVTTEQDVAAIEQLVELFPETMWTMYVGEEFDAESPFSRIYPLEDDGNSLVFCACCSKTGNFLICEFVTS